MVHLVTHMADMAMVDTVTRTVATADMVAMADTAVTECLSWEDMAVTGHPMEATVAAHIIKLFHHPQLQRRGSLKDSSAGTAVHLCTGLGSSVVSVVRPSSDSAQSNELSFSVAT